MSQAYEKTPYLTRQLGLLGAIGLGLGSIIGTGVFVSIGLVSQIAGSYTLIAIFLASTLALCNALSSAELAASHPVSGGTYEYGYRYIHPQIGYVAGWLFLCAKSASAATAAIGAASYLLALWEWPVSLETLSIAFVVLATLLILSGLRRSNQVNGIIVLTTFSSLTYFVLSVLPSALENGSKNLDFGSLPDLGLLEATALMFVAYTGYGRIATLGEEVVKPRLNIPRAILATLFISSAIYLAVAGASIASVGPEGLSDAASPLQGVASRLHLPVTQLVVSIGALTAMLGVLLNLLLGLSRVLLAMGRRGDMPRGVSLLNSSQTTPYVAVIVVGLVVLGLALVGDVKATWSFSAFTVLLYYSITNAAALRLPDENKLYPRLFNWTGLFGCLFLAFWVEVRYWIIGLAVIVVGLLFRAFLRRCQTAPTGAVECQPKS